MAAVVYKSNIQDNATATWQNGDWQNLSLTYFVSGFATSGVDSHTFYNAIKNASGLPSYNSPLSGYSGSSSVLGIYATKYDVTILSTSNCGTAQVVVTYTPYQIASWQGTVINVNAFGQYESSTKDVNGVDMVVTYKGIKKLAEYNKFNTYYKIQITKRETNDPSSVAQSHTGKINSDTYRGNAAGTWLCESITSTSANGTTSLWTTTYSLAYYSGGWNNTSLVGYKSDENQQYISPSDAGFITGYGSGTAYFVSGFQPVTFTGYIP